MAVFNIHGGHNPSGKIGCGAVGILDESREDRIIKDKVIQILRGAGHTVYDCTVDDGTSQSDVLRKIVAKCNSHTVDLDVSIHLNCGRNDYVGDGSIGGTEVFVFNRSESNKVAIAYAKSVVESIAGLGFRIRDDAIPDHIKENSQLYVLRNTKAPAILVETLFCDDADDVAIYNSDTMASAIANGILSIAGGGASASVNVQPQQTSSNGFNVGDKVSFDAIYSTAYSTKALKPKRSTGVITRIKEGATNPYLIDNGMGWTNSARITTYAPTVSENLCYPAYTGGSNSISQALRSMNIDSSFAFRKKIASANGITGYTGSYTQNVTMLTLLKRGQLKKA